MRLLLRGVDVKIKLLIGVVVKMVRSRKMFDP